MQDKRQSLESIIIEFHNEFFVYQNPLTKEFKRISDVMTLILSLASLGIMAVILLYISTSLRFSYLTIILSAYFYLILALSFSCCLKRRDELINLDYTDKVMKKIWKNQDAFIPETLRQQVIENQIQLDILQFRTD